MQVVADVEATYIDYLLRAKAKERRKKKIGYNRDLEKEVLQGSRAETFWSMRIQEKGWSINKTRSWKRDPLTTREGNKKWYQTISHVKDKQHFFLN